MVTFYKPYSIAFYNPFYELGLPDITFEIKNLNNGPVTIRVISEYQGYSHPAIITVIVLSGETKIINHTC